MYPINLIVATFKQKLENKTVEAIAIKDKIPINDKSDKAFFKEITSNSTMFVTSKTLQDMLIYTNKEGLLSRNRFVKYFTFRGTAVEGFKEHMIAVNSKYEVLKSIWDAAQQGNVSVIGGSSLYDTILEDDRLFFKTNVFKVEFAPTKHVDIATSQNELTSLRYIDKLNEKASNIFKKYTSKEGNNITIYTS